ncbi:MAG: DUF309 domain-containing protein [Candidatus Binatia bacterium]
MKITTRNLLAELLIEALDDPIAATALQCLAQYSGVAAPFSPAITVEQLLEPTTASHYDVVLAKLQSTPLLAWDLSNSSGQVTLAAAFVAEGQEIRDKFTRFNTALHEWSSDTKDTPVRQALKKGALLFNHHLFFEVHEVLEAQWMLETGEEKRFLQGLIQIAVAFYHRERGNLRGALSLLQDGLEKVTPHRPTFLGIELEKFTQRLETCRAEMLRLGEAELSQFRSDLIPPLQIAGETGRQI